MINKVTFARRHRCFQEGATFDFRSGVNLLVGDQGTGKSTLIAQLRAHVEKSLDCYLRIERDKPTKAVMFDFERDNPRIRSLPREAGFEGAVLAYYMSHGEHISRILAVLERERQPSTFLLDEPDTALSIRSICELVRRLKQASESGHQVICSVHNPFLIREFSEVLSLEHRCWMNSEDFIQSHLSATESELV